jgi:hypothetical protein
MRPEATIAGSVCWVISGFDLREPLHADGVDFCDPMLERGAITLILDLVILQSAFKGDELPLLESFGVRLSAFCTPDRGCLDCCSG